MPEWSGAGRLLILGGTLLIGFGLLILLVGKIQGSGFGWFGKLPGDFYIKRDGFSFYAPLTTSLLVSVLVSLLFYMVSSIWRR